jgi:hypothetical protein
VTRALPIAALAAALVAPAAAPAAGPSCPPPKTKTFFRTATARVYYTPAGRPFGCLRRVRRAVALDSYVDPFYAPGDARLGQVRQAADVIGYTWIDPGIPAVYVQSVDLRRGRTMRRVQLEPQAILEPDQVAVTSLAVRASGSLAWIQRLEGELSVWRLDRRGRHRLDVGPGIAPTSLRLRASRLSWRSGGVRRVASMR